MEKEINIAEILKNKPEGTKLWTDMFGEVTLYVVTDKCDAFQVKHHNKEPWFDKDGKLCKEGVLCIYPSKSMRDWSKFAWKKGDVLVNSSGFKLFFDRWANDDYTRFFGKVNLLEDSFSYETEKYTLASKEETLDTLEIEKPEFKNGDILIYKSEKFTYFSSIFILNTNRNEISSYVRFSIGKGSIDYDVPVYNLGTDRFRYATEEEKQQLFDALAKEGKAWDAEKKQIVDLKPKIELKPFDKVLSRRCSEDYWVLNFYSHKSHKTDYHICIDGSSNLYCIPYNEETAHLLGTTDDWEGGEV